MPWRRRCAGSRPTAGRRSAGQRMPRGGPPAAPAAPQVGVHAGGRRRRRACGRAGCVGVRRSAVVCLTGCHIDQSTSEKWFSEVFRRMVRGDRESVDIQREAARHAGPPKGDVMSFFHRNRHDPNERPFVSWAPSAPPDTAAQTETAVTRRAPKPPATPQLRSPQCPTGQRPTSEDLAAKQPALSRGRPQAAAEPVRPDR